MGTNFITRLAMAKQMSTSDGVNLDAGQRRVAIAHAAFCGGQISSQLICRERLLSYRRAAAWHRKIPDFVDDRRWCNCTIFLGWQRIMSRKIYEKLKKPFNARNTRW